MPHQQRQPILIVVPGQPPADSANDTGDKSHLRQYPINGNFENFWKWPEVMEAEGVKVRP